MKVALQLSGGKDSLACLYLMESQWDNLTVYWCNTGDAFPETVALMERLRAQIPHFVEIKGNQPAVIAEFGIPTDLMPADSTPIGIMGKGGGVKMQDRYSCCWKSLMAPLHQRMMDDGVTHLIRGQKNADRLKGPLVDGEVLDGIKYMYPIQEWTDDMVLHFLRQEGREMPRFYESLDSSPDCVTCSAYWEEGRGPYLKKYHPAAHTLYQARLKTIRIAVVDHIAAFEREAT